MTSTKITNPLELKNLSDKVRGWRVLDDHASITNYRERFGESIFEFISGGPLEKPSDDIRMNARNAARFAAYPNEIEITPQIARFIYMVSNELAKKQTAFENEHGTMQDLYWRTVVKAPVEIVAKLLLSDYVGAASSTGTAGANFIQYDRDISALIKERDNLIGPILDNYKLSKNNHGEFVLQLQHIVEGCYRSRTERGGYTIEYTKRIPNAGLDQSLKLEDFPALPSSQIGG